MARIHRKRVNARVARINRSILALLLRERTLPYAITFLCHIATDVLSIGRLPK